MLHQHNHGVDMGDKRRAIYYPPTGTGRDTYIMTNNGGTNVTYHPQGVAELGNYMKFGPANRTVRPASFGKIQKIASDGTGRDQYVINRHGGQVYTGPELAANVAQFRHTLRHPSTRDTYEALEGGRRHHRNPSLSFYQGSQTRRLSTPKRLTAEKFEETVTFPSNFKVTLGGDL